MKSSEAHKVVSQILQENEWRTGEFAKFKRNAHLIEESLWCRMCVPMIYAHWEGFILSSLGILVEYLNKQELFATKIPTPLAVVAMQDAYSFLAGKQSFSQKVEFTDQFKERLSGTIEFSKKINTKSNLNSRVLQDICAQYCLRYEMFSAVSRDIDQLVHVRNRIAHGENAIVPNLDKLVEYIRVVEDSIELFLEEISYFLDSELYSLKDTS